VEKNSKYPSKKSNDSREQVLGAWVARQKQSYSGLRQPLLSEANVDQLLALPGWTFPAPSLSWSAMLSHAKIWCGRNNNTLDRRVVHVRCKDGWLALGSWVEQQAASTNQRNDFRAWYQSVEHR
jgi:hypothetical protein